MKINSPADAVSLMLFGSMCVALVSRNWFALAGIFTVQFLTKIIKNIVKQPRPTGATDCNFFNAGGLSKSYGMPSGHMSEFMAALVLLGVPPWGVGLGFTLMSWARVAKGCHTPMQTIIGGLWGIGFAIGFKKIFLGTV